MFIISNEKEIGIISFRAKCIVYCLRANKFIRIFCDFFFTALVDTLEIQSVSLFTEMSKFARAGLEILLTRVKVEGSLLCVLNLNLLRSHKRGHF